VLLYIVFARILRVSEVEDLIGTLRSRLHR
jgi:hypothetical protein